MVVVTGSWVKNAVSYPSNGDLITPPKMAARAVLICRANSHPFQERTLALDQPVKIGRSVARARAVANNAIFDCKVLSRNHALLWYENGKFYLQDTKSSNGTFVNNQRLSKNAEESVPREVCSSDIVQFGVDVMENARKVTHGCIVATLKLYLPDGKEAKASPPASSVNNGMVPLEDLYQLNQYLQEALMREQQLDKKLLTLQILVENTRLASDLGWKALIDEDRLLSRVEILENQLQTSSKNFAEDKLREELRKLQEDKCTYQGSAKESVRHILQEKLEAVQKLQSLEQSLSNSETECAHLKKLCERSQQDLQDLSVKYTLQLQKVEELTSKLQDTEEQSQETCERLEQEKRELQNRLQEQIETERSLQVRLEAELQKTATLQSRLNVHSNDDDDDVTKMAHLDNMKETDSTGTQVDVILERMDAHSLDNFKEEMETLRYQLKQYEEELRESHALVNQLRQQLELLELEEKDKLDVVNNIKVQLEDVRNEEDSSQEATLQLQERIDDIELELSLENDLVHSENENNKNSEAQDSTPNNDTPTPNQANLLKAEKAKLQELLAEARAKKRASEVQKGQYQLELDCANIKVKKTSEEANVLKQQLQAAQMQMNEKNEAVQELQNKIKKQETSAEETKIQLAGLQAILLDEQQQRDKHETEAEQLRKQLMEAQQNAKQSHNEAEQMKDRLKAVQAEMEAVRRLSASQSTCDNKSREELVLLQLQCSSLQEENDRLRISCGRREDLATQLTEAQKTISGLRQRLARQVANDTMLQCEASALEAAGDAEDLISSIAAKEEELVVVKENFSRCNDSNTQLVNENKRLRDENKHLMSQSFLVPVRYLVVIVLIAVLLILYMGRL